MSMDPADHHENFGKIYDSFEFWPSIADGATIIDLGCGGGVLTRKLAARNPSAKIIGVDIRPELIAAAKQRSEAKNIEFIVGDAGNETLLKLGPVDGIFCRFLMEDLADPQKTLSYMHQVLKPGGWIRACERLNSFSRVYPDSKAIEQVWNSIYHFFEKEFGKSPLITNKLPSLFESVGFQDVKTQGFSAIVSKATLGETFEWYVGTALGMFQGISKDLIEKKFIEKAVMETALSDYQRILSSPNSFILEAAVGISGSKH